MGTKETEEVGQEQSIVEDEGNMPEITVTGDGRVSLKGEEIPEDVTDIDDSIVQEEIAPKTDELEPDAEPAPEGTGDEVELTEAEDVAIDQALAASNIFMDNEKLTKRYGSLDQMVERQGETDRYISDLELERNRYREMATPKEEPKVVAPSEEDYLNDPVGTVTRIVQGELAGQNKKIESMEYKQFVQSKSDYAEMDPLMQEQLNQHPELGNLGYAALPILYKMAKVDQLARVKSAKPVSVPVPSPNKVNAETSPGKKTVAHSPNDMKYWITKTPKEIESEIGFAPNQE